MSVDPNTDEKIDEDTDDTIIEIKGNITVADKRVAGFAIGLKGLFEKYAEDDSWQFKLT